MVINVEIILWRYKHVHVYVMWAGPAVGWRGGGVPLCPYSYFVKRKGTTTTIPPPPYSDLAKSNGCSWAMGAGVSFYMCLTKGVQRREGGGGILVITLGGLITWLSMCFNWGQMIAEFLHCTSHRD